MISRALAPVAKLAALALVPASLALQPQRAEAILTFHVFPSTSPNTATVVASGELNLIGVAPDFENEPFYCRDLGLTASGAFVFAGSGGTLSTSCRYDVFAVSTTFTALGNYGGSSTSGLDSGTGDHFGILYDPLDPFIPSGLGVPVGYRSGPINSTSEIPLSGSLSGSGLVAEFEVDGRNTETIRIFLGPPSSSVPAPLPIVGGLAAFGWSRKMRSRIAIKASI